MRSACFIFLFIQLIASSCYAHEDVKNPTVKARMMAMSEIASNMKILGNMARDISEFDSEKAKTAFSLIGSIAAEAQVLFKEPEMDPKSEATSAIWENYDDFISKARALEIAAFEAENNFLGREDLIPAMRSMGGKCKSCHSSYRQ